MVTCIFTGAGDHYIVSWHWFLMVLDPKSSQSSRFANAKEAKNCHMVYPDGHGCLHEFLVEKRSFCKTFTPDLSMKKNQRLTQKKHNRNHGVPRMEPQFSTGGYFPDSVSSRASRHVKELETLVKDGAQWLSSASVEWVCLLNDFTLRLKKVIDDISIQKPCKAVEFVACLARKGTVIFVVQRGDLRGNVRPSAHHDPKFAEACRLLSQVWIFYLSWLFKISR